MTVSTPRYSKAEFARLGNEIYERETAPRVEVADAGKFAAIDIEMGAYELDAEGLAAMNQVLASFPSAQEWLRRIGSRYSARFGSEPRQG